MRAVFLGTVYAGAKAGGEQAGGHAFRADRAPCKPLQALTAGDRMVGNGTIPECFRGLLRRYLADGAGGYKKQNGECVSEA